MPVFDQPTEDLRPSIPATGAGPRRMINTRNCVHHGLPNSRPLLNDEERWTLAMKGWYQVIARGASGTETGDLLDAACDDLSACIDIVSEILGGKSHEPFPVIVHLFRAFFKHMVKERAKPSAFRGASEVMNFSKHVLGLCIEDGGGSSPWIRGILRKAKQDKPMSATSLMKKFMLMIVARLESSPSRATARLGDLQSVSDFMLDVIDIEGEGPRGYVEMTSWSHKLRRMCPALPLIAPVRGVGVCPWITAWVKAAVDAGLPFSRFDGSCRLPLLPGLQNGVWTTQPISTAVATKWLQGLLERSQVNASATKPTGHSLKCTTLSWLLKFGTCRDHRLILGHHSETGMADIYARDTQAAPLRSLECLAAIRAGNFCPDLNRSGFFEREISNMHKVHSSTADTGANTGPTSDRVAQSEVLLSLDRDICHKFKIEIQINIQIFLSQSAQSFSNVFFFTRWGESSSLRLFNLSTQDETWMHNPPM